MPAKTVFFTTTILSIYYSYCICLWEWESKKLTFLNKVNKTLVGLLVFHEHGRHLKRYKSISFVKILKIKRIICYETYISLLKLSKLCWIYSENVSFTRLPSVPEYYSCNCLFTIDNFKSKYSIIIDISFFNDQLQIYNSGI